MECNDRTKNSDERSNDKKFRKAELPLDSTVPRLLSDSRSESGVEPRESTSDGRALHLRVLLDRTSAGVAHHCGEHPVIVSGESLMSV